MAWRTKVENELRTDGENFWIGFHLIRAMNYADALRCTDLIDDGDVTAEVRSKTIIII